MLKLDIKKKLYIGTRAKIRESKIMAVANLKKIDKHLKDMYEDKVTVATTNEPYVDRSEVLFAQMNFIAMANKEALHLV